MAESYSTELRNAQADAMTTVMGNAGLLRIYTAAYAVLLSEHVCGTPFAPAASVGVLTYNAIASAVALASGDAALARFYKADGSTLVRTGIVVTESTGAGPLKLAQATVAVVSGQTVVIDSAETVQGNP